MAAWDDLLCARRMEHWRWCFYVVWRGKAEKPPATPFFRYWHFIANIRAIRTACCVALCLVCKKSINFGLH